tara:strand:+ start:1830 stop:2246 length:417 start_codon:yes stop_codon:yes gene_type:complete
VTKKKKISQKDLNIWKNYLKSPNDIVDKDLQLKSSNLSNRYRYDLHGFTLIEANEKVKEIILSCIKKNYNEILLITGKGIHSNVKQDVYASQDLSKLKHSVPEFIKSDSEISKYITSIKNADRKDGGDGAIVIKLKRL